MIDALLGELLAAVPGARGAVFCDAEGESVGAAGTSGRSGAADRDDLRIAGAQLATPLEKLALARERLGEARELVIRGEGETLLVQPLKDGYYLVVCLAPDAGAWRAMQPARSLALRLSREL